MSRCWGLVAEFSTADALLAAARRARAAGYLRAEAYSPFAIDGLAEALGAPKTRVPAITFLGALGGAVLGFFVQWYSAVIDYPVNIAGRPLNSWPMFLPTTFEIAVLFGALSAVGAMLVGSGLPRLHHPLFGSKHFDLASRNRFFLCLRCDDPAFEAAQARRLLEGLQPLTCTEVDA